MEKGAAPTNDEGRLPLLLLEDDPLVAELVRHVLAESAPEFDVQRSPGFQALGRLLRLALERRHRTMR